MRGTLCTLGDQVVVVLDDKPAEDGTVNVYVLPTRGLTVKVGDLDPVGQPSSAVDEHLLRQLDAQLAGVMTKLSALDTRVATLTALPPSAPAPTAG